jgi:hypothetical protein
LVGAGTWAGARARAGVDTLLLSSGVASLLLSIITTLFIIIFVIFFVTPLVSRGVLFEGAGTCGGGVGWQRRQVGMMDE